MPIFTALMGFSLLLGTPAPALGAIVPPAATTVPASQNYVATLTAYNAVPAQTDSSPFETASGLYSNPEIVMARSQDLAKQLPFGTVVEIDGTNSTSPKTCGYSVVAPLIGYRVIADTMNARYTDRVDVLFSTHDTYTKSNGTKINAAQVLGICKGITVRVVGHIDITDTKHLPKTQRQLAALVGVQSNLAIK